MIFPETNSPAKPLNAAETTAAAFNEVLTGEALVAALIEAFPGATKTVRNSTRRT